MYLPFEAIFTCNYLEDRVSVSHQIPWQTPAHFKKAAVYNHFLYQQVLNLYFVSLIMQS